MKYAVVTALAILILAAGPAHATAPKVDQPAPAFTLKDSGGKEHALADFQGKYVVLEWVNFDCPFVRKHYKSGNMQAMQKSMTEQGVVWLSICSSAPGKQGYFEGEELTGRLAEEKAVPTAYLIDSDGTVGKRYEAKTTPQMFLISPEGTLLYAGAIDDKPSTDVKDVEKAKNYVKAAYDAATAGKAAPTKSTKPYGCSVKY